MIEIEKWCLKWGFALSTEKTVGIVFCETNKPDKTRIILKNKEIKFEKHTKFLGMIVDQRK